MSSPSINPGAYFLPVELQKLGWKDDLLFHRLAQRGLKPVGLDPSDPSIVTVQQVPPWIRWRGIATYLACVEFANKQAYTLPTGAELNILHATPGQYYSASIVFFARALADNISAWLCDAFSLSIKGADRSFLTNGFKSRLTRKQPQAKALLDKYDPFIRRIDSYRQAWIHNLAGGSFPIYEGDEDPFVNPQAPSKWLGVPLDPAICVDEESYAERARKCIEKNGRYLCPIDEFTREITMGCRDLFREWLAFSLDYLSTDEF
jgi:hypothetical protein